jgi:hypothetical protein
MESGFLSTTVEPSCEKEGDEKKRKTGEKKTEEGSPGLKRRTHCMPCGASPPLHLLIKAGGRGTAESPPSPHPPPLPQLVQSIGSAEDLHDGFQMEVKSRKTVIGH